MSNYADLMGMASDIQFKATDHVLRYNEQDPEYAIHGVDGYYAQVPSWFQPFSQMPDPANYQPMIDNLREIKLRLSAGDSNQSDPLDTHEIYPADPTLGKMNDADQNLVGWTGSAATTFKRKFLDPFSYLARNQYLAVSVLKAGLEAHQAMWTNARKNIADVAQATIDSIDHAGHPGICGGGTTWNVAFTVLASIAQVAAVAVAPETAGLASPLRLTVIGAAAQITAAVPPGDATKQSGSTAIKITNHMRAGMTRIANDISTAEAKIANSLNQMAGMVHDNQSYFVASRPALADVHGGAETGSDGMGQRN